MMLKEGLLLSFIVGCLILNTNAQIIAKGENQRLLIGKNISLYTPKNETSFKEVRNTQNFIPSNVDVPNLGLNNYSIWIKISVTNKTNNARFLLELAYPMLDEVELWAPDDSGIYKRILLGESKNFNSRKYKHPNYTFDLNIPKNKTINYFLRVKSGEQIILPLFFSRPTAHWQHVSEESAINGIYLGIVLIMFLYNLFVFFSVRDRSYFYYVFYLAFVGLTQIGIKGYTFQYLWPNQPDFALKSVIIFASLSGIGALLVTRNFLNTRLHTPRLNLILTGLIVSFAIALIFTLLGYKLTGFQLMQIITTITTLFILGVSCIIMLKGYKPAVFFFSAWIVLICGAIVFLLKDYNLLPYNTFTSYAMQGASAIEMALLSFGLANRINILKKEKEQSQAQALSIAKENERIIREQNVILEQKVIERTVELEDTNHELHATLENLQQTQSQLVEAEKMASLGQLTAGIAHEINNPINFVMSNIAPLTRDVGQLLDLINLLEEVGLSETDMEIKVKKIADYKEELEFDYLKIEINQLLKGIGDGAFRTAEIVKGLRIFSRLDEDGLKKADLNEGLESTLVLINNQLNNNIKLIKKFGNLPLVECYPGKLNQVFLNIFSNAIYAINQVKNDNFLGILEIMTTNDDKSVFIHIKDNGIGMDEKTKAKIFEPFFTTKKVGEGTGLGMSITYNIIKRHNGNIIINSGMNIGTEFILRIPIFNNNLLS